MISTELPHFLMLRLHYDIYVSILMERGKQRRLHTTRVPVLSLLSLAAAARPPTAAPSVPLLHPSVASPPPVGGGAGTRLFVDLFSFL